MSGMRRVVFASDLHLGSNPTLDDFTRDVEFESFLDLPEFKPSADDRVELVLLGDSFDLWQAVSEEECHQEKSKRIDLAYVAASEAVRLDGVRGKHLRWFEALGRFAERPGCRLVVVPGNHERSLLPHTRFAAHPRVHVFDRPRTFRIDVRGTPLALAGFPYERAGVRQLFPSLLEQTGWRPEPGVAALLCMHQCVEGATVGPADFMFRYAADVVRGRDIPAGFAAVLSGHIHRHQVLKSDLSHRPLAAPVLYPGSIERTALAEKGETKGYMILRLAAARSGGTGAMTMLHPDSEPGQPPTPGDLTWEFRPLPARPMIVRQVQADGRDPLALEAVVREIVAAVPEDAVLTIRVDGVLTAGHLRVLSAAHLRTFVPASMNVDIRSEWSARAFSGPRPAPKRDPRSAPSNGPLFD